MEYLYNSKAKTIRALTDDSEEIQLGDLESRFIEAISNGYVNSWGDIAEYVYGHTNNNPRGLKDSILAKVKLNIVNAYGYGIVLKDKIYIR